MLGKNPPFAPSLGFALTARGGTDGPPLTLFPNPLPPPFRDSPKQ